MDEAESVLEAEENQRKVTEACAGSRSDEAMGPVIRSGKKALLDVISRRVQGPTRGQILLNNQPMTMSLFQQNGGYFTHKCDLIPGLTVEQTLFYTPTKLTGYQKKTKVKQIMADLALSQVANRCSENLTKSEYRRLIIGVQLIKDPDHCAPVSYDVGPPVSYDVGPPVSYDVGPPVSYDVGPPVSYDVGPPVSYDVGPPVSYDVGPPVSYDVGPPVSYDVGPPVSYDVGPPVSYDVGPPSIGNSGRQTANGL
ncbi:unnamed protein product [Brassicogethes aeneus]|uniref:ABC transporter domain-containing protein n=1 Tax=Brassicogethes aeneus TaxID=1431903 RepID=A0A9P0B531_BRAAE|nr:unnamed protein product [Brassicogethes aeneus]